MRKESRIRSGLLACLTALMMLLPAAASASSGADAPQKKVSRAIKPLLPSPEKDAAIVVDGATGKVLYDRNPDAIRYPASLTKMMTLYLLFEALEKGTIKLDTPMITSVHASEQEPTKLAMGAGAAIPVDLAIKAITVLSANDVAVVIAETLGDGSEEAFAHMMTDKAHQFGMMHTNFHNASGLPDLQQLTTARDMAILARHLAYDFPQYFHYFSVPSFTYNGRAYGNHDNLLAAFDGTDGIKTGYTQLSGFNLVTSAVRDNRHVIGVVLGGPTAAVRDREMMRLLTAVFNVEKQNPTYLAEANVPWKGGRGPEGDLFRVDPGQDESLMLAALDAKPGSKSRNAAPVLMASAKAGPAIAFAPAGTGPAVAPILEPAVQTAGLAPSLNHETGIEKNPAPRIGPTQSLALADNSAQVAQGDSGGAAPALDPPAVKQGLVKRWAVQVGAFASEALAQTRLAAFLKRGGDIVGEAQALIVPFTTANGRIMYRARVGMFAEDQARDICKRMVKRGQSCFAAVADAS